MKRRNKQALGQPKVATSHARAMNANTATVVDKNSKRVIGTLWMGCVIALGVLLSPMDAHANDRYQLDGELIVDGHTIAKPQDQIEEGSESYVIVQGAESSVRLTYSVQSGGDNLLNTRFIIEQDSGDGWELLMQPSVQAVIGQPSSVSLEADPESDRQNITFEFTFTAQ